MNYLTFGFGLYVLFVYFEFKLGLYLLNSNNLFKFDWLFLSDALRYFSELM